MRCRRGVYLLKSKVQKLKFPKKSASNLHTALMRGTIIYYKLIILELVMRSYLNLFIIMLVVVQCTGAYAYNVFFEDHFDDGVLDSSWIISYGDGATGWSYTESGSSLTVTNVTGGTAHPSVQLRYFIPTTVGEFYYRGVLSWSQADDSYSQISRFITNLVSAGFYDAFVTDRKNNYIYPGEPNNFVGDQLALSGSMTVEIARDADNLLTVEINDELISSRTVTTGLASIGMVFRADASLPFGEARVDEVYFAGTSTDPEWGVNPVPEPVSIVLLFSAFLSLILRTKK